MTVNVTLADEAEGDVNALHFAEDGVELLTAERNADDAITFDAPGFSVYGIVYTVDFHWEVDGRTYDFSIPGGGFLSLEHLAEALGLYRHDAEPQVGDATEAEEGTGLAVETEAIQPEDIQVSEEARAFVADIAEVSFSAPELVSVSKVEENTTVGAIKDGLGLACEYSDALTEEQIAQINATEVEGGDWALISLKPFDTEETMTVTMTDGEVFTIRVTDAQIKTTVIDAKGETWEIAVTYDDSAEIPDDAELRVKEILPEDARYQDYYQKSLAKVGVVNVTGDTDMDNYAHVFDIQIWHDDFEIEPASPVSVSIRLLDTPEEDGLDLKVVHFGETTEVLNAKSKGDTVSFETTGFSVYGIVEAPAAMYACKVQPYCQKCKKDDGTERAFSKRGHGLSASESAFTTIICLDRLVELVDVEIRP